MDKKPRQPKGTGSQSDLQDPAPALTAREEAVANRETWVRARERATGEHEVQLDEREEVIRLCEESLRTRTEAEAARVEREHLLVQMREANEKLVVATIRADELAQEASAARTAMARSAEALRESEASYRALFNSIDAGFCVVEVLYDDTGNPVDLLYLTENPAFERHAGLRDVVGKRLSDFAPDLDKFWLLTYGNVVATGESVRFTHEALNRWFDVFAFRVGDPGKHQCACLFSDVTASRQAQQAVEHLAAIVTSSDDAMITKDLQGTIQSWNEGARRLFGYTAAEAIGQSVAMLIPPDRIDEEREILERIRCGDPIHHYETVRRRKDGSLLDVSLTISPLRDGHGRIIGAAKVARDITVRKRAEAQVRATSRAKDEFLAMLGHELRNPLAPIVTALDLITMQGDDQHEREHTIIDRQVKHLMHLVDDLLDISRITSGKIELHRAPIELSAVVWRAVEMTTPLLETKRQELRVNVEAGLVVDGDTVRLAQAIGNVLTNAAKYTPARGTITVTGVRCDAMVTLTVKDTGIGISPEMLPRVFDLFAQERQASDRAPGGLGLGLAIVRTLVGMHGGTVIARSDGIGLGSEFVIELPAARSGSVADAARPPRAKRPSSILCKILVVDDNRDAAELTAASLRNLRHDVRVAFDGPSALSIAAEFAPNVVLLDIGLPVMDGYEVAVRMRELLAPREVHFIAITGYGQPDDRRHSEKAGFDKHLVKPVDMATIEDTIQTAAQQGHQA